MIEVKQLTKFFGTKKAVDDISFRVEKGEILGFLGPNGAGKSTTMRMITGFLPPSAGTAVIGGSDILTDSLAARKKIGYLPENAPVYSEMTVSSYLAFCAEIRGFSGSGRTRAVERAVERCFLSEVRFQAVSTLSKGYRQRVCFAQSILHDPEYLIFDEPTDGLDPNQKHEVRLMIRNMAADKVIVLSTHILDEVDAICTRAVIIAEGRIVADDTPANLRAQSPTHGAFSMTLPADDSPRAIEVLERIEGLGPVEAIETGPDGTRLRAMPGGAGSAAERIVSALAEAGVPIRSMFIEQGRLDEVFRTVTTSGR